MKFYFDNWLLIEVSDKLIFNKFPSVVRFWDERYKVRFQQLVLNKVSSKINKFRLIIRIRGWAM